MGHIEKNIFKQASTTYYWSSRFFPSAVRDDVARLYSFVRLADDYVDAVPARRADFKRLRKAWDTAKADPHFITVAGSEDTADVRVVKNMVAVSRTYAFDLAWVETFLDAMQSDLDGTQYETLDDTLRYVHGSAEVIGLMMAKILNISPEAYEAAALQGRAMQFINFIRDIQEDVQLGRQYFPREDLERFGLPDLTRESALTHKAAFRAFITLQLKRYHTWQTAANAGLHHVPRRTRIALKTAIDMYNWTGRTIARNPHIVYERKIKPARRHVLRTGVKHALFA